MTRGDFRGSVVAKPTQKVGYFCSTCYFKIDHHQCAQCNQDITDLKFIQIHNGNFYHEDHFKCFKCGDTISKINLFRKAIVNAAEEHNNSGDSLDSGSIEPSDYDHELRKQSSSPNSPKKQNQDNIPKISGFDEFGGKQKLQKTLGDILKEHGLQTDIKTLNEEKISGSNPKPQPQKTSAITPF